MRHIGISQWGNVSEVNRKRGGSWGAKRSSWLFMSILIMFSEQWIADCGMCVLLYCWVSIYMCRANLMLTLIRCLNIHKRYPVYLIGRFHDYFAIIPCCQNLSIYISLFVISSSSEVKERENPPFLSTSRRCRHVRRIEPRFKRRRGEHSKIYSWHVPSHFGEGSHNITSAKW